MINKFKSLKMLALAFSLSGFLFTSCGGGETNTNTDNSSQPSYDPNANAEETKTDDGKGVGPITEVTLGADVDAAMATKGKEVFEAKCTACHEVDDKRKVGPGLAGVTERRKPEWVMNMILNPEKMVQEDPQARELLAEYIAPMANQNLTEEEARNILEYFRQNDKK